MHTARSFDVSGVWHRWSSYDLLNGVIVAAKGAELVEYDPWNAFRSNAGKYRAVEQPYIPLLELHRGLADAEARGIRPSRTPMHRRHLKDPIIGPRTRADELILKWCNEHGLLGLVPVLSCSIRLGQGLHHFRDGGQWFTAIISQHNTGFATITKRWLETGAHSTPSKTEDRAQQSVTWLNWQSHEYEEKCLEHIELFLRPVWKDEALNAPRPNTREFWNCYGEPLDEFTYWCEMFARAVDYLSQWESGKANGDDSWHDVQRSHWLLSGLAQSAAHSFTFKPERNTVDEARMSAGLLASYALMFLWDKMEGRRALRCSNCHRYFVSDEHRARYCSRRCRNTAQSRRYRAKKETSGEQ